MESHARNKFTRVNTISKDDIWIYFWQHQMNVLFSFALRRRLSTKNHWGKIISVCEAVSESSIRLRRFISTSDVSLDLALKGAEREIEITRTKCDFILVLNFYAFLRLQILRSASLFGSFDWANKTLFYYFFFSSLYRFRSILRPMHCLVGIKNCSINGPTKVNPSTVFIITIVEQETDKIVQTEKSQWCLHRITRQTKRRIKWRPREEKKNSEKSLVTRSTAKTKWNEWTRTSTKKKKPKGFNWQSKRERKGKKLRQLCQAIKLEPQKEIMHFTQCKENRVSFHLVWHMCACDVSANDTKTNTQPTNEIDIKKSIDHEMCCEVEHEDLERETKSNDRFQLRHRIIYFNFSMRNTKPQPTRKKTKKITIINIWKPLEHLKHT